MLLSESDAARGFGFGRNLPRLGFALGMRLDSGAAGVPVRPPQMMRKLMVLGLVLVVELVICWNHCLSEYH